MEEERILLSLYMREEKGRNARPCLLSSNISQNRNARSVPNKDPPSWVNLDTTELERGPEPGPIR